MRSISEVPAWPSNGLEDVRQCPVCDSSKKALIYQGIFDRINLSPGLWNLKRCGFCGSCFLDPRPDRDSIGLAYISYYTHVSAALDQLPKDSSFLQRLRNGYLNKKYGTRHPDWSILGPTVIQFCPLLKARADYSFRYLLPVKGRKLRLLELGCGNGAFLKQMDQVGWDTIGIEPDPRACDAARQSRLNIIEGSLEDAGLNSHSFDAISMNHVIEHLHDPIQQLILCRNLLKPGGQISVITPNFNSLASKIFKIDWYALHPPAHLCLFTRPSLVLALRRAGFIQIKTHPSNSFGFPAAFHASINNKPRLGAPYISKNLHIPGMLKLLQYLTWAFPSLGEEAVVTARAPI